MPRKESCLPPPAERAMRVPAPECAGPDDELNEGDQILVKVLAIEGNKIKLSRRAILKEQHRRSYFL